MIRQYWGQRRRAGANPLGVGVVATGSIYYLQDRGFFHDRFGGRWEDITLSGRSDTAVVRSLRDGRRCTVAVRILELHDDHDLTMQPTIYPSVPNLALYRRRAA